MSIIRFKMEELILYLFAVAGEQKKKRARVWSHPGAESFSRGTQCRI